MLTNSGSLTISCRRCLDRLHLRILGRQPKDMPRTCPSLDLKPEAEAFTILHHTLPTACLTQSISIRIIQTSILCGFVLARAQGRIGEWTL